MWQCSDPLSHLIANVELPASRGRARRRQVGQDDGGQHRAPPGLHDHDAEYLAFGLGDDHLWEREDTLGSSFFFIHVVFPLNTVVLTLLLV